ncbi:MAG: DegT/DnrJ/EryC1/StrS family aminotransferase, partial [Muribaculaceae bacterium]|nr:DegT/DnrJ/EryC1/StrS family aminotransferase [Muribaculaceae bacterium]
TSVEPDADVEALRMALAATNIESRPLWKPMHCQPVFANAPAATNGVSVSLFHRGLCLPSGPDITRADQERIADLISAQLC